MPISPPHSKQRDDFGDNVNYAFMQLSAYERVVGHIKHNKRNIEENLYCEKAATYCKENHIDFIITVTPTTKEYIEQANKFGAYLTHYEAILKLCSLHNVPIFLYDETLMSDEDFGD